MKEKEEGDKLDTSDKADSTLLPGVLIAECLPGSGEDKKVTLTAFWEADGDIDGDIIETVRTKPGWLW